MNRWHVRCSRKACQARDVFARHPDDYVRLRKCVRCGGTHFRVIRDRTKDRGDPPLCTCGGYLWVRRYARDNAPRRRGSPQCWYDKDGTPRPLPETTS